MGPMTGRGAGYCAGYPVPGSANPGMAARGFAGRGSGAGWGGRGRRNMFYATGLPGWARAGDAPAWGAPPAAPTREQEVEALKAEADQIKDALDNINHRIDELTE